METLNGIFVEYENAFSVRDSNPESSICQPLWWSGSVSVSHPKFLGSNPRQHGIFFIQIPHSPSTNIKSLFGEYHIKKKKKQKEEHYHSLQGDI